MGTHQEKAVYETLNEVISVQNVSFSYGEADAAVLENINFNIYRKDFVCVMGPSGCGKSTLLNILAGFTSPTSGTAYLEDKEIVGTDWHRGVVFQQPPLFEWFTVRKNVAFGPLMRKEPKEEVLKKTDEMLERVGLADAGNKKIFELSGGMKQRVAIARSLINDPEILLMDEPFGALDALTRQQMQDFLRKIWWSTGKTIFFITHDVDEALRLGSRVIVMSKDPGRIVSDLRLHFTEKIIEDGSDRSIYSGEFFEKRNHILELISEQNSDKGESL